MNQSSCLKGNKVLLRKPVRQDVEDRIECGRHPEIVRIYGGDTRNMVPLTSDEVVSWYEIMSSTRYGWMIEYEGKCIGTARLTVNEQDRRARYAIGLFDITKLGLGLGTEATQLVLKHAFETLELHRVDLKVLEYNQRAIACFRKCGFTREGVEREGALIEDRWETDVIMSILEQEHENQVKTV